MMSISLLSPKLSVPPPQAEAILRPDVAGVLLDGYRGFHHHGGFALISAPAGSGKTTLLREFVAALPQPAAWLSLDDGDNDPIRFWSYVIAAIQTVEPQLGQSALASLQASAAVPDELIPTLLIADLAKLDHKLVLILDDYQVIQDPAIHAGLSFLLKHNPDPLYIVLSSHVDPPWSLAQFRVRDDIVEVRAPDLRPNG